MSAAARLCLDAVTLGRLMPMFLWLDTDGMIRAMGPTLTKLVGADAVGAHASDHIRMEGCGGTEAQLWQMAQDPERARRIKLRLKAHPDCVLRGHAVPIGDATCGPSGGVGILVALSFGIGLIAAVRAHDLTDADFAPTDMAMELLFLNESRSGVMAELRALNERLEDARREAEAQAMSDPLTGLANRRALEQELERVVALAARGGSPFALAHIDLDHFKEVNDTLGHAAGDGVLARAAEILREETRRSDMVARIGGDEFVMVLRGTVSRPRLKALGERIIARLETAELADGQPCRVSASMGVAISSDYRPPEAERMLADADAALYVSKRAGRGCCTVAEGPRVPGGPVGGVAAPRAAEA
ncbi:GGDEF domain-containing protein [Phaeovulum vinaykumarii]|uniref:diguanylate cyclase n=1 Tax=Phaeovulum vinaykumarii TaxID=407234 RepID=A0A1N7KWE1_9RHOB|nr:GGDEF domain-containing protein [Phaeovulum vinaykumarii]SIS65884.1 diguanylate cyclase (GGDEF) domain-containing protein [Phaeovulum vinaykumarii]SOC01165.1 diguanylate cyclase (GGDEF)-like protein [Phaeovulum vinaykumarii]